MKAPALPLWRMTRVRYDRLIEAGIFGPEDRVELLDGLLVAREAQSGRHATAVGLVHAALERGFGRGWKYDSVRLLRRNAIVAPLAAPRARIRIEALLP